MAFNLPRTEYLRIRTAGKSVLGTQGRLAEGGFSIEGLVGRESQRFLSFIVPFLFDTAAGVVVILAVFAVGLLLQLLRASGMAEPEVAMFERAHVWIDYAVYIVLALDLLGGLMWGIRRRIRDGEA